MRMPKKKVRKEFKREYIPVIIAGIILLLLIVSLIFAIFYKLPSITSDDDMEGRMDVQEILVDSAITIKETNREEYEKLLKQAQKIEVTYNLDNDFFAGYFYPEDYEGEMTYPVPEIEEYATFTECFDITFKGLTSADIYLYISDSANTIDDEHHIIFAKDDKSDVEVSTGYVENVNTYTVEIRIKNGDLAGTLLRKFTFKTPFYNYYSKTPFCVLHSELKACAETSYNYISSGDLEKEKEKYYKSSGTTVMDDTAEYIRLYGSEEAKKLIEDNTPVKKDNGNSFIQFIKENLVFVIIIGIVVILGVAATVIFIVKKKRSSKYEI